MKYKVYIICLLLPVLMESLRAQNEAKVKVKCFMSMVVFQENEENSFEQGKNYLKGWLYHADNDTLVLLVKGLKKNDRLDPMQSMQVMIPAEKIKRIYVWRRSRVYKGMAIGGVGMGMLGAGFFYGLSANFIGSGPPEPEAALGGLFFVPIGIPLGAWIGSGTYRRIFKINGNPEAYKHARAEINDRFAIQSQLNP